MSTLTDNYMVIAQLISLDLSVICDNERNGLRQVEILFSGNNLSNVFSVVLMYKKCIKKCNSSPGITVGVG